MVDPEPRISDPPEPVASTKPSTPVPAAAPFTETRPTGCVVPSMTTGLPEIAGRADANEIPVEPVMANLMVFRPAAAFEAAIASRRVQSAVVQPASAGVSELVLTVKVGPGLRSTTAADRKAGGEL